MFSLDMNTIIKKPYSIIKTGTRNYVSRINYTYQHKKAFLKVEKELLGKNTTAGYLHDTNKIVMYALGFPKSWVRKIHRTISPHHPKNHKVKNPVGMVIDWVCSPLTKSDKTLSAREYYEKKEPEYPIKGAEETLKRFGM